MPAVVGQAFEIQNTAQEQLERASYTDGQLKLEIVQHHHCRSLGKGNNSTFSSLHNERSALFRHYKMLTTTTRGLVQRKRFPKEKI